MSVAQPKILLVDDDPAMLRLLGRWLERDGYDVRTAEDGHEALALVGKDCPDFIVTDWEMPRLSGIDLCRAIRSLNLPHYVYITFLTVRAASEEIVAGLEAGADDFLKKPVNRGELAARLHAGTRVLDLERRLSLMASTDSLTGLRTQRSFFEAAEKLWRRVAESGAPLSCVMCDVDYFKRVNDLYGHPSGDAVLRAVSEVLRAACPTDGTVCRYGGEEFCIMLPGMTEQEAAAWAEAVRCEIAALKIEHCGRTITVTSSFGASQRYADTANVEALVDQADQGLLCSKRSGRDRVTAYQTLSEADEHGIDLQSAQEALFKDVCARDVMTPLVASVREEETIGQAAEFFLRSRVNSSPVVDAEGRLTGMLSEKDLMAAVVSLDWWTRPVREVMKPNVISYSEDTPVRAIYDFLCRVSLRRIVIVEEGRPTGTISRGTLLRWFRNLVISRGLLADHDSTAPAVDPHDSRQRLVDTAEELSSQAALLQRRLADEGDDLTPLIVGSASGIQELVNDLLAYSRFAGGAVGAAVAAQRAMTEGNSLD